MPTYNEAGQGGIRTGGGFFVFSGEEISTIGLKIVEHAFVGETTNYPAYDATKTNLGPLMRQNTGIARGNQWAGPMPLVATTIRELPAGGASADLQPFFPYVIAYSDTLHWIFMCDLSTAANTRKIAAWTFDITSLSFEFKGAVTLTFPGTTTAHTVRAFRVTRHLYRTGTVEVNGTAVTGNGTGWQTAGYASGTRIGFGSTDPTQISDWYMISAIGNDTSITLETSAGTISAGTPFVIDELRVPIVTTNATATQGGMFLAKGLCFNCFGATGRVIPAATTTDNIQAVYGLKDATTTTILVASGIAVDEGTDLSQDCYVCDNETTTTVIFHKFNLRAALTGLSSGSTTAALLYKTQASGTLPTLGTSGTTRMGTLYHGHAAGEKSIFMYTSGTYRIYRVPVTEIRDNESVVFRDAMPDVPPGTVYSTVAQGFLNLEISQSLDMVLSSATSGLRGYLTKYYPEGYPVDLAWGAWTGQIDGSTKWPNYTVPHFNAAGSATYVFMEGGIAYLARSGGTLYQNTMYAVPFGADWNFTSTTNARIITPALSTPHAKRLRTAYVNCPIILGSHLMGTIPEPYRVFARTGGIQDDSGTWTRVEGGDLTHLVATDQIQFMFEFRTAGTTCVPARIYSVSATYEVPKTDPHFEPTLKFHYSAPKFVWWFKTAFGCDVPKLRVQIWDADTEALVSDDNTDIRAGKFEKSIDNGATWTDWNNVDKPNETTYVRYTYRAGTSTIVRSRLKAILSLV